MDSAALIPALVEHVRQSTRSLTPSELIGFLSERHGLTRRGARLLLSESIALNKLAYRQVLGRTVVVESLNCYYELAPGVTLTPPHLPVREQDPVSIVLGESISFGNGTHPTTRMCARLLMEVFSHTPLAGASLDLGSGTGVLGLLALKLGADFVDATEIDPIAMHDAKTNARENSFQDRFRMVHADDFSSDSPYSLVMANLRTPTLISLRESVSTWSLSSSDLIFSGIQKGEEDHLLEVYGSEFALQSMICEKNWVGLHLKKK